VIYDPRIGRRWILACLGTAILMTIFVILVAAGLVTQWMLLPGFVWFASAVGGSLLYGLQCLLAIAVPTQAEVVEDSELPVFGVQRFQGGECIEREDSLTQEEMEHRLKMLWGSVPPAVEAGGDVGEEWKFALGEDAWVIVIRQS
jgi:hypothetical protein